MTGTSNKKTLTDLAEETGTAAEARARKASDTLKKTAQSATRRAKSKANEKITEKQNEAAGRVEASADAARAAAEKLETGSVQRHATERIAESLNDAAVAIRQTDMRTILDETNAFARRNPVLFAGGAALLGFAAARLLKASEGRNTRSSSAGHGEAFQINGDRA